MEPWHLVLLVIFVVIVAASCQLYDSDTTQQTDDSATIKPQRTAPLQYSPPRSQQPTQIDSLYAATLLSQTIPLPSEAAARSTTTYTNSIGIGLQVAPPVVVDMSPDAPLPAYTPNPTFQDIQFSSHPRPTIVTTIAEDPAPVPTTRE